MMSPFVKMMKSIIVLMVGLIKIVIIVTKRTQKKKRIMKIKED